MEQNTFDPAFFEQLKEAEADFFWFDVRRKWIFDKITRNAPPPSRLLEIGCGTGNVSNFLAKKGYSVTGCDTFQEALKRAWPGFDKVQGDAADLPFNDNTFDIAGLFDVIEHFQDDVSVLREAARVVRPGGLITVTVPAKQELWSWVDEAALHKRRYTKEGLGRACSEAGLMPCTIEYMFMSLYFPMKLMRSRETDIGDSFKINRILNFGMKLLFDSERLISSILPLPIGTSLISIARKR